MKASDLLVQCLESEGIEYVFGVPGEETADLMFSLERSEKIDFVLAPADVKVLEAEIVVDNVDGRYPSDHFPVTARLVLPAGRSDR